MDYGCRRGVQIASEQWQLITGASDSGIEINRGSTSRSASGTWWAAREQAALRTGADA
jgi:hypothetical protein